MELLLQTLFLQIHLHQLIRVQKYTIEDPLGAPLYMFHTVADGRSHGIGIQYTSAVDWLPSTGAVFGPFTMMVMRWENEYGGRL